MPVRRLDRQRCGGEIGATSVWAGAEAVAEASFCLWPLPVFRRLSAASKQSLFLAYKRRDQRRWKACFFIHH
jgi:hypothetical protein